MADPRARPDPRLPELLRLAQAVEERDCAALTRLTSRIAALRASHAAAGQLPRGDLWAAGFAQAGGIDGWGRAAQARRKRINAELAPLLANRPAAEHRARAAIARRVAIERLITESVDRSEED